MTTVTLFCTVDVPKELIDDFLTSSASTDHGQNLPWSLIRCPSQRPLDSQTDPPISSPQTFITHFPNHTIPELGSWLETRLASSDSDEEPMTRSMSRTVFAVLDQRSKEDNTAVIAYHEKTWPQESIEAGNMDPSAMVQRWRTWRVRFEGAGAMAVMLAIKPQVVVDFMDGEDGYDDKGVYKVPGVDREV